MLSTKIITEARSWIGTNFHHQGRIKLSDIHQGGCDCIGLIMGVSAHLNLISRQGDSLTNYDVTDYSPLPSGDHLYQQLALHFHELPPDSSIIDGDIGLFSFTKNPQHVAFFTSNAATLIHAYLSVGKVTEHIYDQRWQRRLVTRFRFAQCCDEILIHSKT